MKRPFLIRFSLLLIALTALALWSGVAQTKPIATPELPYGGKWVLSPVQDCDGIEVCAQWDIEGFQMLSCCIDPWGLGTGDPTVCDLTHERHGDSMTSG